MRIQPAFLFGVLTGSSGLVKLLEQFRPAIQPPLHTTEEGSGRRLSIGRRPWDLSNRSLGNGVRKTNGLRNRCPYRLGLPSLQKCVCEIFGEIWAGIRFEIWNLRWEKSGEIWGEDFSACQGSTKILGAIFGANFEENFGNFVSNFTAFLGNFVQQKGGAKYRRCGVDTEIPYRLFSLRLCSDESLEADFTRWFWRHRGNRCWMSVSGSYRR